MAIIDGEYTITEQESRTQKAMALLEAKEAGDTYSAIVAKIHELNRLQTGYQKAFADLTRYSDGVDRLELLRVTLDGTEEARSAEVMLALGRSLAAALDRKRTAISTMRLLGLSGE